MCRAKDHFLAQCPHHQDFLKKGWLVPAGDGTNRTKLRDEVRMPRDDPELPPRHKQIEEIAKVKKWDQAESYFANMYEEDDDDMNKQLQATDTVQVLMRGLIEAQEAIKQLTLKQSDEARRPTSHPYGELTDGDRLASGKN